MPSEFEDESLEGLEQEDPGDPIERLTEREKADLVAAEPVVAPVTYSGQDFDVVGLVRRLNSGDILVPTFGHNDPRISSAGFQRSFVWTKSQMDRFIESLLLGYPVPGIFLVKQSDRRYLVLDGQQRLRTLQTFMEGMYQAKEFSLENVAAGFKGLTYKTLPEELRRQVDDTFFQGTVVATDGTNDSLEAIYQIFERVNSGGTQLTPHEIRVALFAGPFIDFLEGLNLDGDWRTLYGKKSPRLRDQELILRVLALLHEAATYKRPLKTFLNGFVGRHRTLENLDIGAIREDFAQASRLLAGAGGRTALRPGGTQLNAALTEAVFVGLMRRLAAQPARLVEKKPLTQALSTLSSIAGFEAATTRATADEESVRRRIEIATTALSTV
jgi:hypothetical protein